MGKRIAGFVLVAAVVLVAIGFILRGTEVYATGATGNLSCGTASSPNTGQAYSDGLKLELATPVVGGPSYGHENLTQCDAALSTRSTWAWVLIGLGAAGLLGGGLFLMRGSSTRSHMAHA